MGIDTQFARGVMHMLDVMFWIGFAITLWLAHGKPLNNRYWHLQSAWAIAYALWYFGLYTSQHGSGYISREMIVLPMAILQLTYTVAGYAWLALTLRASFSFDIRNRSKMPSNYIGTTGD